MPVAGVMMFKGSVGGDFSGVSVFAAGSGWGGVCGSDMAVPGAAGGGSSRADAWEGLRESIVGIGVGLGAGRV